MYKLLQMKLFKRDIKDFILYDHTYNNRILYDIIKLILEN